VAAVWFVYPATVYIVSMGCSMTQDDNNELDSSIVLIRRLQAEVRILRKENERLRKVVETLLVDAEGSAGAAMLGLAIELKLMTWNNLNDDGYSAWTPDELCARWALTVSNKLEQQE
jgi:hypothetical protein